MSNYHEIAGQQLFEGNYDDLIDGDFEYKVAAARMLGRHMRDILQKNEQLRQHILNVLSGRLQNFTVADIEKMYVVREPGDNLVETLKLISETIKGIND